MNIYHDLTPINRSLRFITKYRWIAFILAGSVLWFDRASHFENNLFIVYTMIMVLLGIIYKNKYIILFQSGLVALTRHLLYQGSMEFFLMFWFTFFIFGLATTLIVSNYINQNKANIELTKTLAKLLDSRDPYTATHSENVATYSRIIAQKMKLPKKVQETIYIGGLLHDIGKIVIPETILNKPAKLTDDEFDIIKQHPTIGYNTLKHVKLFKNSGILDMVLHHHERYDGNGYPKGLGGKNIPLTARIMAIADAFDAMSSRRVYRDAKELDKVLLEMENNKGTQFDPIITDYFLKYLNENKEVILKQNQPDQTTT